MGETCKYRSTQGYIHKYYNIYLLEIIVLFKILMLWRWKRNLDCKIRNSGILRLERLESMLPKQRQQGESKNKELFATNNSCHQSSRTERKRICRCAQQRKTEEIRFSSLVQRSATVEILFHFSCITEMGPKRFGQVSLPSSFGNGKTQKLWHFRPTERSIDILDWWIGSFLSPF